TEGGAAVAASARARAAVAWLEPGAPLPPGPLLLLPAAALAPPAALAALRAAGPGAVLATSTRDRAPVLVADAALAAALAPGLAAGAPLGDDLDRALKSGEARLVAEGWYVLARDARGGEWLDVIADSLVHTLIVLAMGVSAQSAAGAGLCLGVLAAVGILGSAAVAKWWPDTGAAGAGGALVDLGSRDGFYVMLLLFI